MSSYFNIAIKSWDGTEQYDTWDSGWISTDFEAVNEVVTEPVKYPSSVNCSLETSFADKDLSFNLPKPHEEGNLDKATTIVHEIRSESIHSPTILKEIKNNKINLSSQNYFETAKFRVCNDEEKLEKVKQNRKKAKGKHKNMLIDINERQETDIEQCQNSERQKSAIAENLKQRILSQKSCKTEANKVVSNSTEHNDSINDEGSFSEDFRVLKSIRKQLDKQKARALKECRIQEIMKIQNINKIRKEELQRKERRLIKRAEILKNKHNHQYREKISQLNSFKDEGVENLDPESLRIKNKLSERAVIELANRLCTVKRTYENDVNNFSKWKKRNGVRDDQRVFIMTGHYPDVRDMLIKRGWFYNEDRNSPHFDLAWTLHSADLKLSDLPQSVMVNHFKGSSCLTTKSGLIKILNDNLQFFTDEDPSAFFPRAYDLSSMNGMQSFVNDFLITEARKALRDFVTHCCNAQKDDIIINPGVLNLLFEVVKNNSADNKREYLDGPAISRRNMISDIETEVILNSAIWMYNPVTQQSHEDGATFDVQNIANPLDIFLPRSKRQSEYSREEHKEHERMKKNTLRRRERAFELMNSVRKVKEMDVLRIKNIVSQETVESTLSEESNLWIVKPASKSRGRGIALFASLPKILRYVQASEQKLSQWCVQKYIEKTMLISNRRFDVRQWVLVTSFDPLTVWFCNDCYVRFASEEYIVPSDGSQHSQDKNWLGNSFKHLVNNSINKNNEENFGKTFTAENGENVSGHMWKIDQLKKLLVHRTGKDEWNETILPKIKEIICSTMQCAQGIVTQRKNTWELFGYDFMLDNHLKPWLIEINSSPSCEYSTDVTKDFVPIALGGILDVVLKPAEECECTKIGLWEQIFKGQIINNFRSCLGTHLAIEAIAIPKPQTRTKKTIMLSQRRRDQLIFDDSDLSDYEDDCRKRKETKRLARKKSDHLKTKIHSYKFKLPKRNQHRTTISLPIQSILWNVNI